jgi:hypothetical protein
VATYTFPGKLRAAGTYQIRVTQGRPAAYEIIPPIKPSKRAQRRANGRARFLGWGVRQTDPIEKGD